MHFDHSDEAAKKVWDLFETFNPTQEQKTEMMHQLNRFRVLTVLDVQAGIETQLSVLKNVATDYWKE